MKFVAVVSAVALLAACQQPAQPAQQAAANQAGNTNEAASATLAAAAAAKPLSKDAALKLMHDRHENMETIGKAVKVARLAMNASPADLATVRQSAATIAGFAPKVPSWFPAGTGPDVGKTMAKPELWQKPGEFATHAMDFRKAAAAFDAAAKAGDLTRIKASFADLGKSCKACHDPFRNEHDKH
jgi:cytochrome c556